ncbi:MAG: hypothetical protein II840_05460 [Kiritimatiellae bacterium]|nr:hypothetical protein [Kiritimatiellia bacterium]
MTRKTLYVKFAKASFAVAVALGATITALATGDAYAAGFWKGTGQDSGTAANWTNGKAFMVDDDFYFRDSQMTEGATYTRSMRLSDSVTSSKRIFFQCGTEADPFVVDGNNHTITLGWGGDIENSGNFFVGHGDNTGNDAGYYGSAVLNGGTWTCNQLYVGAGTAYTGYLRLNGASLTVTGTNEDPCDNGKIVVDDGTLSFTSGWVTIGRNGGTAEFVVNGGTVSCSGDLLFGNASGTLTVNGGTVTVVPGRWLKNYATGTVNLNGGTLGAYHLQNEGVALTVNFNGGTLQANGVCADNGGLIQGGVVVNVNAGGIIDNGGYNIAIAATLGGGSGLIFTGSGTTTLNGAVNYTGKTAVTPGTILAIANSDAKTNILGTHGLVVAGRPTAGQTIVTYTSALEATDLEKVSCPLAPTTFKVGADGQSIVVDNVGQPINYWTGAAGDNNLSTQGNWSLNVVPTGNANIFSATPVTLTKGTTFAPTSITFLEGSAGVTIGGDFTSLTQITNNSYVNQTFSGAVNFGSGNIDVEQTGFCDDNSKSVVGGCVVFAGGVTGNNIANHTVFTGNYTLTTTDKINFTSRFVVNAGSTLTVKNTDQIHELYIMSGATFRAEYASHGWGDSDGSHRLWCWNAGTFIADRYEFYGAGSEGRQWLGGYLGPYGNSAAANANGILKIGTLNINSDGAVMLHGFENDGDVADALTTYIGAGGINITEGKTGYYCVENRTHKSTLRPLNSDFTFGRGSNTDYDFRIGNGGGNINFTFHTDNEQGVAREITLAARVYTEQNTSSITVKGGGTLKVTSASPDMIGSTVVADTATLAFGAGASFGAAGTAGAITLGNGTTLALTSTGNALSPLVNALNLPTGAGEVATIRIDGERLGSCDHEKIATVGNAAATANVTLDENSTALAGRKCTLKVEDGKLLLNIKFAGTIVIIR